MVDYCSTTFDQWINAGQAGIFTQSRQVIQTIIWGQFRCIYGDADTTDIRICTASEQYMLTFKGNIPGISRDSGISCLRYIQVAKTARILISGKCYRACSFSCYISINVYIIIRL